MNAAMLDILTTDDLRAKVAGTTIDGNTLLSTDYFNHFNEVIMLLSMLGDMPEMLDEIRAWQPKTYRQHFQDSGLAFGPLAAQAYDYVPAQFKQPFEQTINQMIAMVAEAVQSLDALQNDPDRFALTASDYWQRLQGLVDRGGAIVHGTTENATMDQSAIDDLF